MREATLLLAAVVLGSAAQHTTTEEPSWAPTGRLSQFRGFATPRPELLEDGRMMYASIWATWSAWSFCSNGVRMRVRACNTVRGFSCLGPNQETRPCDSALPLLGREKKPSTDYDVVDPFEADRREAMKQLYPDDPEPDPPAENNFLQISSLRAGSPAPRQFVPAPPRSRVVDHSLVGFDERRPANEADGAPGSDPEKVFGARQFAVKSVTPDETKEIKQSESEENRLIPMGFVSTEMKLPEEKPIDESFEDITFDTTRALPLSTIQTTSTAETTVSTTEETIASTSTAPLTTSTTSTFRREKFRSQGITTLKRISPFHSPKPNHHLNRLTMSPPSNVFNRSRVMRTKLSKEKVFSLETNRRKLRTLRKRASKILHQLVNVPLPGKNPLKIKWEASIRPLKLEGLEEMNADNGMSISVQFKPFVNEEKKKNIHSGEMVSLLEMKREEEKPVEEVKKETGFRLSSQSNHSLVVLEFPRRNTSHRLLHSSSLRRLISTNNFNQHNGKESEKLDRDLEEEFSKSFPLSIDKEMEELEEPKEVVDKNFEEAEIVGDSAVLVQPKLPPTAVDDNLEDLLEVTDPMEERMAPPPPSPPKSTTEEPKWITDFHQFPEAKEPEFGLTETDRLNAMMAAVNERKEMKLISSPKGRMKKKKFGITGFAFKKVREERPFQKLHDGEVSRAQFSANLAPVVEVEPVAETTTALPKTTTTALPISEMTDDLPEISMDTLNALDWMLKNMSQAAAKDGNEFLADIKEPQNTSTGLIKESFPILPSEPIEAISEPVKLRKRKLKKKKNSKKAEITTLHFGEFVPKNLDKSKMFPKFKSRPMKVMKTRALGVRTINSDKDQVELPTKKLLMGNVENPDQIFEEVKMLQAEMNQIEKQLEDFSSQERQEIIDSKTSPLPLFEEGARFDLFSSPTRETLSPLPALIPSTMEPLRILTPEVVPKETKWGEWSEWGLCFCGKQLRTRRCFYSNGSAGCKGVSYESRWCSGGECPSQDEVEKEEERPQGGFEYNGGPLRPRLP